MELFGFKINKTEDEYYLIEQDENTILLSHIEVVAIANYVEKCEENHQINDQKRRKKS